MEKDEGQKPSSENARAKDPPPEAADAPDPEEDDLDDLDDVLDQFQSTKVSEPPSSSSQPPTSTQPPNLQETDPSDAAADEFGKQLQEQMAALMGNVDETPEMKKEIEAMMQELSAAADSKGPEKTLEGEEPFQSSIRRTMERMQASGDQATTAEKQPAEPNDDLLAQMMKDIQSGGGLEGAGDEEGFNKMLMGMMEQLTNKEILFEPMKELNDKFPGWMEKNRANTGKEDLKRYEEQQRLVGEIVRRFERKEYSDSKAEDREYIVERMQQMQAAGSPPADLVGDMNAAQEALGDMDSGCAQQ